MSRIKTIAIILIMFCFHAYADVEFSGLDISASNTILFSAKIDVQGSEPYSTLFAANAQTSDMVELTFYPESISILDDGQRLQIKNKLGLFLTDRGFVNLSPVRGLPMFSAGAPIIMDKFAEVYSSPNGSMVLFMVKTGSTKGDLILLNTATGTKTIISKDVHILSSGFPARWSTDSQYFIYEKNNKLYYFSIRQLITGIIDEPLRKFSDGSINQVKWGNDNNLYILKERSIFCIMPQELFTGSLYASVIQVGKLVGKVPFSFDPNFDSFWISPNSSQILFCKDGRNIFVHKFEPDDFGMAANVSSMPYLFLQGNTVIQQVLWSEQNYITIFTSSLKNGVKVPSAWRLKAQGILSSSFESVNVDNAKSMSLSPSGNLVAIVANNSITVRRYSDWSLLYTIPVSKPLHTAWVSENKIIIASAYTTELVDIGATNSNRLIAISQADSYGWSTSNDTVLVKTANRIYASRAEYPSWLFAPVFNIKLASVASPSYRVYFDSTDAGPYANIIMVRSITDVGTKRLFDPPSAIYQAFPQIDERRNAYIFDHGSRIRRREVALVFNAYDNSEGITQILSTLKSYNITATFFVNGEFIRRNPGATKLIAQSGHEVGNMFFTILDVGNNNYKIDNDFIRRGLARTEDDYFSATGYELSLLWHLPHYIINEDIISAATSINYKYVGRDVDPLDWVSRTNVSLSQGLYYRSRELLDKLIPDIKPGSIIPIRIGIPDGGREDYFFNELPMLLDILIAKGYKIVPVSTLIKNAE